MEEQLGAALIHVEVVGAERNRYVDVDGPKPEKLLHSAASVENEDAMCQGLLLPAAEGVARDEGEDQK